MSTAQENQVSVKFAAAISSPAVTVPPFQALIWLFGGCNPDKKITSYIDAVAAFHGYGVEDEYDVQKFMAFMTPLIGADLAKIANDIIEDQFN